MTDQWNASVYAQFESERSRPFFDLTARIGADNPGVVVDLGCGDASTTQTLAQRWPAARVIGVDSSAAMLARAQDITTGIELVHAAADAWSPAEPVDVLVTNAMLQWIPGHDTLLGRMADWLAPGGWLALQVPGNFGAASHRILRELAGTAAWRASLGAVLRHDDAVLDAAGYRRVLVDAGLVVDAWETTYLHVLHGEDPVLDWTSGTALRPVLSALSESDGLMFAAEYGALLRDAYPPEPDGSTLFPFRRIFAVACKPA